MDKKENMYILLTDLTCVEHFGQHIIAIPTIADWTFLIDPLLLP